MEVQPRNVQYYATDSGDQPFRQWRRGLTDLRVRAAIDARIARLRTGNFGDSKPIGGRASESRIDFGPGYRIYYGVDGQDIILLVGGHKSRQDSDIRRAREYWNSYKERKKQWKKES